MTVPRNKICGFGGDTHLFETQVGSLILARGNIAVALAGLVDKGWLDPGEAEALARAWRYDEQADSNEPSSIPWVTGSNVYSRLCPRVRVELRILDRPQQLSVLEDN